MAELQHPGIVRIIYYNIIENIPTYQNLPFYLMELVNGASSKEYMNSQDLEEEKFRSIVRKTAETLAYINHGDSQVRDNFAHLDIKAENILITADGIPVIIDLGTCKRLAKEEDKTIIACTRTNAHPQLMRLLAADPTDNNRAKGEVKREIIDPNWDLWSFGLTLLDWLGVDREEGIATNKAMYHKLNAYTRKYYMLVIGRLLSYSLRHWIMDRIGLSHDFLQDFPILNAQDLFDALSRLEDEGPFRKIEELSKPLNISFQASPKQHVPSTSALVKVLEILYLED